MDNHIFVAMSSIQQGNYQKGMLLLQEALEADPENAQAHAYLSFCLTMQDRRYGALEEAERALSLDPELSDAHAMYAVALHNLDYKKEANKALDKALALDPYNYDALSLRCAMYMYEREIEKLEQAAHKLAEVSPDSAEPRYYLSKAASLRGDGELAETYAKEALEIAPYKQEHHEALGWAFLKQNKIADADKAALNALKIAPQSRDAHLLYANVKLMSNVFIGIVHRLALLYNSLSEKKALIFISVFLFVSMTIKDVIRHFEIPMMVNVLTIVTTLLLGGIVVCNIYVSNRLKKQLQTVRLRSDY